MKKMKYHDEPPVKPQPEIIIKEVIREVIKEVPVYQPPQIITKEVIKEVQSPHLIEEINRLTQRLAEKDEIIRQMNFEKIELLSKLNVSEVSKNALMDELTGLKEDKADLRADKARLHEEIVLLRKTFIQNEDVYESVSKFPSFVIVEDLMPNEAVKTALPTELLGNESSSFGTAE